MSGGKNWKSGNYFYPYDIKRTKLYGIKIVKSIMRGFIGISFLYGFIRERGKKNI